MGWMSTSRHDTKHGMRRPDFAFRLPAAVALGCHAFFHGIWIAGALLKPC